MKPAALQSLRREILSRVLRARFEGSSADLAREIERPDSYVWQLLNGHSFGEKIARHIDDKLALGGELVNPQTEDGREFSDRERMVIAGYRAASAGDQDIFETLARRVLKKAGQRKNKNLTIR